MPQKSRTKSSTPNISFKKAKRGRPRKPIAPEALMPFEKQEVPASKKFKCLEKTLNPTKDSLKKRRMNPTTSERTYTSDEVEFMNALAEFKRASGRTFPTCCEILGVLRRLGYEKVK